MVNKKGEEVMSIDKSGMLNFLLKFVLAIIAAIAFYFMAMADIRSDITSNTTKISNIEKQLESVPRLVKSVDSLIIVIGNQKKEGRKP